MIFKTTVTFQKLFHYAVGLVRQESGSTSMGFLKALMESMFTFLIIMSIMLLLRGIGVKIRGEFGFFVLSGVALFMMHNKIISTLSQTTSTNQMLSILSISKGMMIVGSLLHVVYMQLAVTTIFYFALVIYYGYSPVQDWNMVIFCLLLTILWSIALSILFLSIMPLNPPIIKKITTLYRRIGMITSGKMIPGNLLAIIGKMGGLFIYNPLFHIIDQMRGGVFQHYVPGVSNLVFPIQTTCGVFTLSAIIYFALKNR